MPSPLAFRVIVSLCFVWLVAWIVLSWGAVQDDAMIHLRYAHNLLLHASITYDGVHSNYGASSLLYVCALAFFEKTMTGSPDLPRLLSTMLHLALFLGLSAAFDRHLPATAHMARKAALVLSWLLATPTAVRWLDDGMETGTVLLFVTLTAWLLHEQTYRTGAESEFGWRFFLLIFVSFFSVLLRTELTLLCALGLPILAPGLSVAKSGRGLLASIPTVAGAAGALATIFAAMHVLLPDTAIAKSMGIRHWFNPIWDTAATLGGAFSFGAGLPLLWTLTLLLVVLRQRELKGKTLLANCCFPVMLTLSALRGQEIQGVRYFAWAFFFSTVWNVLELSALPERRAENSRRESSLLFGLVVLLIAVLPYESVAMHRVLRRRADTVRRFEAQDLSVLRERRGVASDIGYIGYFTQAQICDLAGLVNGRAAARMSTVERAQVCAATNPDFVFLNASQLDSIAQLMDMTQWQICGQYDFTNVSTADVHYLIVMPGIANEVCGATKTSPLPVQTALAKHAAIR